MALVEKKVEFLDYQNVEILLNCLFLSDKNEIERTNRINLLKTLDVYDNKTRLTIGRIEINSVLRRMKLSKYRDNYEDSIKYLELLMNSMRIEEEKTNSTYLGPSITIGEIKNVCNFVTV